MSGRTTAVSTPVFDVLIVMGAAYFISVYTTLSNSNSPLMEEDEFI